MHTIVRRVRVSVIATRHILCITTLSFYVALLVSGLLVVCKGVLISCDLWGLLTGMRQRNLVLGHYTSDMKIVVEQTCRFIECSVTNRTNSKANETTTRQAWWRRKSYRSCSRCTCERIGDRKAIITTKLTYGDLSSHSHLVAHNIAERSTRKPLYQNFCLTSSGGRLRIGTRRSHSIYFSIAISVPG